MGSGIVFPAIFSNVMEFTLPVGSAISLPLALASVVEAAGGAVLVDSEVKEILVTNGRATGVRLANGETMPTRAVC